MSNISYWICRYTKSDKIGTFDYIPIIECKTRENAEKILNKTKSKQYIILPQIKH